MTPARARGALLVAWAAAAAALRAPIPEPLECAQPAVGGARRALAAVACEGTGDPLGGAASLLFGRALDVNRADARALEALPGIGPGRAAAIVRARTAARFCSVRELERVPGLGRATVGRITALIAAGPAAGCARP